MKKLSKLRYELGNLCTSTAIVSFRGLLFSHSVMSNCLHGPHGLQHASLPSHSPSPRTCSNSCPLSWWYHPIILSSVVPFSSLSFLGSGSFSMSQLFASGDQSIGVSASVLLMNIQGCFPLGLTGLISLQSKGLSRVFSSLIFLLSYLLQHH